MRNLRRYRQTRLDPLYAHIIPNTPDFVNRVQRKIGAKGRGLKYEEKVNEQLHDQFPMYASGVWFCYATKEAPNRRNYAQPDGLLIDIERGHITIVEIKYNHTPEAYFQLMDCYLPLCEAYFGKDLWTYSCLEVVNWYDSRVPWPTQPRLRKDICGFMPNEVSVHILRLM